RMADFVEHGHHVGNQRFVARTAAEVRVAGLDDALAPGTNGIAEALEVVTALLEATRRVALRRLHPLQLRGEAGRVCFGSVHAPSLAPQGGRRVNRPPPAKLTR